MSADLEAQTNWPDARASIKRRAATTAPAIKFYRPTEDMRDAERYRNIRTVAVTELGISEEEFDHGIDKKIAECIADEEAAS